ncbi:MAG: endolytic transglycosylase MltG, partial [Chloroflexia bacterium]|nr:endolytic transglycosylase MltG [Chloroflexia bacterium]
MIRVLTQSLKIISIVVMALLVIFGSAAFFDYWRDRASPESLGRPVTIQIAAEDDTAAVSDKLTSAGLVRYGFYFETRMRLSTGDLLPGTYTLRRGMGVPDIIDAITVEGTGGEEEQAEAPRPIEVTLIEGQRAEEFGVVLEEAGVEGGAQAFMAAVNDPSNREQWDFLEDLPQGRNVEGYLFPDTYTFGSNATAADVVDLMLGNFDARFTPEMRQQTAARGLSIHEVVTLASIVEREAQ